MGTYGPARGDAKWKEEPRCTTKTYLRGWAEPCDSAIVPVDLHVNGGVAVAGKHPALTAVRVVVAIEAEEGF
jgi:hypothetical protein